MRSKIYGWRAPNINGVNGSRSFSYFELLAGINDKESAFKIGMFGFIDISKISNFEDG
jgi:hypothetical protein